MMSIECLAPQAMVLMSAPICLGAFENALPQTKALLLAFRYAPWFQPESMSITLLAIRVGVVVLY